MGAKHSKRQGENALEMLRKFDTILIIDDSTSMRGSRWEEAGNALAELAEVAAQYDSDGIDIHFLNSAAVGNKIKKAADVKKLFSEQQLSPGTPIGKRLDALFLSYLRELDQADSVKSKEVRPINFIVITDGVPTDDPEKSVVTVARELDKRNSPLAQLGIQFVQIGDEPWATQYLRTLDNNLRTKHDIRDLVDTTLPEAGQKLDIVKILTGGVNRRVDNDR